MTDKTEKTPFKPFQNSEPGGSPDVAQYAGLARECLAGPAVPGSLRPLRREVRRALKTLRRAGRASVSGETGFREWLDDNYHLLSREGEQLLSDLRFAGRVPLAGRQPMLCLLLRRLVNEAGAPDEEGLDTLIAEAGKIRPLTVFELEQLPLCLRAALVLTAADACRETGAEAERLIAAAVNGLRAAADLDFDGLTERHSIVERLLRKDPAGVYPKMDDRSRADYRRRTALAAQRTGRSEAEASALVSC